MHANGVPFSPSSPLAPVVVPHNDLPDRSGAIPFARDPRRKLVATLASAIDLLPLSEWFDRHLRGDYFFRKGHLLGLLERQTSRVYCIFADSVFVGVAVVYSGSYLHNLLIDQDYRGQGIGEAIMEHLQPIAVRVKTNMQGGDPAPFYQSLGYTAFERDQHRPHIVNHVRPDLLPDRTPSDAPPTLPSPLPLQIPDDVAAAARRWHEHQARVKARGRARTERLRREAAIYSENTYHVGSSNGSVQVQPPEHQEDRYSE
jgi:GNAT superfamily N-acetyltransferase